MQNSQARYEGQVTGGELGKKGKLYNAFDQLIYEGEFQNGNFHGKGVEYGIGTKYEGEFRDGKKHGRGTLYIKNEERECMYNRGEIVDGYGETVDKQMNRYEGMFKDGKYSNYGRLWNRENKLLYEGNWKNGSKYGAGNWYDLEKGMKYRGTFKKDKKYGKFIIINLSDSRQKEIEFQEDEIYTGHGRKEIEPINGAKEIYEGALVEGLYEGFGKLTQNGRCYEGYFKKGQKHGKGKTVDQVLSEYSETEEGEYRDGRLYEGISESKTERTEYKEGKAIKQIECNKSNEFIYELNGPMKSGPATFNFLELKSPIRVECILQNNVLHGPLKAYFIEDEKLICQGSYEKGFPVGFFKIYQRDGTLKEINLSVEANTEFMVWINSTEGYIGGWDKTTRRHGFAIMFNNDGQYGEYNFTHNRAVEKCSLIAKGYEVSYDFSGTSVCLAEGVKYEGNFQDIYFFEPDYKALFKDDETYKVTYQNGDIYEGPLKNGKHDGKGHWTKSNKISEVEYKEGVLQSGQTHEDLPDNEFYDGEIKDFKKHGHGCYTTNDGEKLNGIWEEGSIKEGNGIQELNNELKIRYQGEFKSKMKHGIVKSIDKTSKNSYQGTWEKDKPIEGDAIFIFQNGDIYLGGWKKGKRDGFGTLIMKDRRKYEGDWVRGVMHGKGVMTYKDGSRLEGKFEHGGRTEEGKLMKIAINLS